MDIYFMQPHIFQANGRSQQNKKNCVEDKEKVDVSLTTFWRADLFTRA
jgi:hypothetical protein